MANIRDLVMVSHLASGVLEAFSETGTEGVIWSVLVDGLSGYDSLLCLQDGDELKIFGRDADVVWAGVVDLDRKCNWQPYPTNPKYGQQAVLGMWVHGIQRGVEPEIWARWFFDRLRCEVKFRERLK